MIPKAIVLGDPILPAIVQCVISKRNIAIKRDQNDLFFVSIIQIHSAIKLHSEHKCLKCRANKLVGKLDYATDVDRD
ncbi:hypothetical protein F3J02_10490 [Acinetobacter sp. Tr-809]|nr:hypothetical protein [Acinetobacter sp. Tr-809]